MTKPKIEVLPIEQGATPDPNNVNKHTAKGGKLLTNSLQRRGAFRSIASAGKDTDVPVVGAGNFTLENAVAAGFTEIVNVHVTGGQLVNVVRDDIAPGSPEFYALAIEDNEISKASYAPDIDMLAHLAASENAILAATRKSDAVLDGLINEMRIREGGLFSDMDFPEDEKHGGKSGSNVYALTIPCSKDERDWIIKLLNEVKKEKGYSNSLDSLLYILRLYANPEKADS